MRLIEAQIDRVVGPTHHFGGLGVGNVASHQHKGDTSNPRAAALQGLAKMRLVAELGVPQIVLPPQDRPDWRFLQELGFGGPMDEVLTRVASEAPVILSAAMSCSAMWTANAATVAASVDGAGDSVRMTVANLNGSLHRAIEPLQTHSDLAAALPLPLIVNHAIPGGAMMRDEGAANHLRLGSDQALPGIHVFVHGDQDPLPKKFWPRQTLAACQAIARRHQLPPENTFFLKQHPDAIDAGAFHNDVVAASHHGLLLHHQMAFHNAEGTLDRIGKRYCEIYGRELVRSEVAEAELSIDQAIATYLFNSQIVSPAESDLPVLICPMQVVENKRASTIVSQWIDDRELFERAEFLELRQSMSGGGGPACLRLRVPMTTQELSLIAPNQLWSTELDQKLCKVVQEQYPESLCLQDLSDSDFVAATTRATQSVCGILRMSP